MRGRGLGGEGRKGAEITSPVTQQVAARWREPMGANSAEPLCCTGGKGERKGPAMGVPGRPFDKLYLAQSKQSFICSENCRQFVIIRFKSEIKRSSGAIPKHHERGGTRRLISKELL